MAYLDDFLTLGATKQECERGYQLLSNLLLELGFTLSVNKAVAPCQQLVFLGIQFDSFAMTLSLPLAKLVELHQLVKAFLSRKAVSKRELQRLIGKLNWACRVVYGGRTFLRRIIDLMNDLKSLRSQCIVTGELISDLQWWNAFLDTFNGKCAFFDERPIIDLQTDACQVGAGAFFRGDWAYWNFYVDLPTLASLHINYKECLCIVLAALRWAPQWQNKRILVLCDNQAAVAMINKGSTKNTQMMAFLRILFWLSASYNFRITAKYLPGKDNRLADCASRLHEPQMMLQWGHLLSISKPLACLDVLTFMSLRACMFLLNWFKLQSTQIFTSSHFRNTSGAIPGRPRIQESHVCRQHQSFVSHSSEEVY